MEKPRINELIALFLAAMSTLLFEITITKVFGYIVWANYAYMVISTAMFGLGFSGVILTRWPNLAKIDDTKFFVRYTILCSIFMVVAFLVVRTVPIHLPDAPKGWGMEMLNVAVVFLALTLPFVFFGMVVAHILDRRGKWANTYYFADLVGAGLGAFLLVPLIPYWGPQGLALFCALATMAGAFLFVLSSDKISKGTRKGMVAAAVACLAASVVLGPHAAKVVDLKVHVVKRSYKVEQESQKLEATAWSALSRIDIAHYDKNKKRVWIDGGQNESSIIKFDGDYEKQRARRDNMIEHSSKIGLYHALPHLSKKDHSVCMIGTSGGEDSQLALTYGARKVVGVEMDPQIARFVTQEYRDYAGGLFTDGDYTELIVDEGRSYLRRSGRKFDVIQQVNNFTPIAMHNGALNLSEAYLLTTESFYDFWNCLEDDGILCITRWGAVRMLSTAVEMFREMGMTPEEYSKHLVVVKGIKPVIYSCMVKKSPWTQEEIDKIFDFYNPLGRRGWVLYAPHNLDEQDTSDTNIYYQLATSPTPEKYWSVGGFDFSPPDDNRPFFNHFQKLAFKSKHKDVKRAELAPLLPQEIIQVAPRNKLDRRVPQGDLPPIIVLFEAFILSALFFGLPMMSKKELRDQFRGARRVLGYFACLGLGFIMVEICLMQRLVLFLGTPVYSISVVLGGVLIFAGLGSLIASRFQPTKRTVFTILWSTAVMLVLLHFAIPVVTEMFLGLKFGGRLFVSIIMTAVAGLLMGMPLPIGIRFLKEQDLQVIPWAWAINGFFTVIGTALTVILAVNLGFAFVFMTAAFIYFLAPFFFAKAHHG